MGRLTVHVFGVPIPEGSVNAYPGRGRRTVVTHRNQAALNEWRTAVNMAVLAAARQQHVKLPLDQPVEVTAIFDLPRPKRPRFPVAPATKPDLDKLARAVGDALAPRTPSRRIIADDSRITSWNVSKYWADLPEEAGADITIYWVDK